MASATLPDACEVKNPVVARPVLNKNMAVHPLIVLLAPQATSKATNLPNQQWPAADVLA